MNTIDFIATGWRDMLGKEAKCAGCGCPFNPQWSNQDHLDRDICEKCDTIEEDLEQYGANQE